MFLNILQNADHLHIIMNKCHSLLVFVIWTIFPRVNNYTTFNVLFFLITVHKFWVVDLFVKWLNVSKLPPPPNHVFCISQHTSGIIMAVWPLTGRINGLLVQTWLLMWTWSTHFQEGWVWGRSRLTLIQKPVLMSGINCLDHLRWRQRMLSLSNTSV